MSDGASASSAVSRTAAGGGGRGHGSSEPKTKKQRLVADAADKNETEEELYQKAVSLVFGGELYAKFLTYAGPEGIAYLRGDRRWREAMDELSADDKKVLNLPSVPRPTDLDLRMLRTLLTEPMVSPHTGRRSGWVFNELGRKALAASPLTSNKTCDELIHKGSDHDIIQDVLNRQSVPAEILKKVVRTPGTMPLADNISRNPNLTAEISASLLYRSMTSSFSRTIINIAKHKNTGELELSFLSLHEKVEVRCAVAGNEAAGRYDLLHSLSMDDSASVRRCVARNKSTSLDDLITLSMDPDPPVRAWVATNPNVSDDLLNSLSTDPAERVRCAVASNAKVSVDATFNIADKKDRWVLARHSENPETLAELVGMDDGVLDLRLADNQCTPPAALERLSDSDDSTVLRHVASNRKTPESVLQKLVEVDHNCRERVASNPSAPIQTLEVLAKDEHWAVREEVARNESTTPAILESMLSANEEEDAVLSGLYENRNCSLERIIEKTRADLNSAEDVSDALVEALWWQRNEAEKLPTDVVVAMSKVENEHCRYNTLSLPQLPVSDIVRFCRDPNNDAADTNYALKRNPVLQVAVDKLSHLLSSSGVGSDSDFEKGEHWW